MIRCKLSEENKTLHTAMPKRQQLLVSATRLNEHEKMTEKLPARSSGIFVDGFSLA